MSKHYWIRRINAHLRWHGEDEDEYQTFGVFPEGYDGDGSDLPGDNAIFYWLTQDEARVFGTGFGNGDWVVTTVYRDI